MTAPFGRGSKIVVGVLAAPTIVCLLLAALHIFNETWGQWSTRYGWANMWMGSVHNPFFFVFALIVLIDVALLLVVGIWWFLNRKNGQFPKKFFAVWFLVLLTGLASYF